MEIFYWCLIIIGGFLLGGVMFCQLIPKSLARRDICKISVDGNPGAFNVFKHCGKRMGIPCLTLDVLKGFIPSFLAAMLLETDCIAFSLAMAAPVLGHAAGVFNRFHGGKGISASFGVALGIIPVSPIAIVTLTALYATFSTVLKINPASRRSVVVYALFAVISCTVFGVMKLTFAAIGCGLVAALPIVKFLCAKNGMVENRLTDGLADEERKEI